MQVHGTTRVLGIIGHPVSHTWSPQLHNAAFAALHLNYVYVPFHIRPNELRPAVQAIRALGLHGLNVTIPHKETVLPLLDQVSAEARLIGAVNTIGVSGRRLIGYNTDGPGFLAAYREQVGGRQGRLLHGQRVVLIGAGGAARAVAVALAGQGISSLILANRTASRAEALRADLARRFRNLSLAVVPLRHLFAKPVEAGLLINATPLGMSGHPSLPLPRKIHRQTVVCDLVYDPPVTALLRTARAAGSLTVGGAGVLLHQAALAFEIWTGHRAPLATMRAVLKVLIRDNL